LDLRLRDAVNNMRINARAQSAAWKMVTSSL